VTVDVEKQLLMLQAKAGRSLDPYKIFDAIKNSRFHGRLNSIEITAVGAVVEKEGHLVLDVSGTAEQFVLGDDPDAKSAEKELTPFQRLREALRKGAKVTTITGRAHGLTLQPKRGSGGVAGDPQQPSTTVEDKPSELGGAADRLLVVTTFQ